MSASDQLQNQILTSPKVGATVAAITTGTGAGSALDWIPDDIGKLATLVGIILSVILIAVHSVAYRKANLELSIMRTKEEDRKKAAAGRMIAGEPRRREEDS